MQFKILHIVSNLKKVNFGIWNAAITGAEFLREHHDVESVVWVCDVREEEPVPFDLPVRWLGENTTERLKEEVNAGNLLPENTIIVSHGCWMKPTKVAQRLKRLGFRWVYVPHGMLEPWSMRQGRLKKQIYYNFIEKRLAERADAIRAVSQTEQVNLENRFRREILLIENGVDVPSYAEKKSGPEMFLFIARLHHKKGIFPLVKTWKKCVKNPNKKLIIAGPDEGELKKILPYVNDNIQYVGAVYGDEKADLLKKSHYFLLPSYSEGFPTSVVEAMGFGLIPLISKGCNFPEVFSNNLGYNIEPDNNSIERCLTKLTEMEFDFELSRLNHQFILDHFSVECIGGKLFSLYSGVMALD